MEGPAGSECEREELYGECGVNLMCGLEEVKGKIDDELGRLTFQGRGA